MEQKEKEETEQKRDKTGDKKRKKEDAWINNYEMNAGVGYNVDTIAAQKRQESYMTVQRYLKLKYQKTLRNKTSITEKQE